MSELSNRYREIMEEIDEKITDEEQLNFVKNKISEMSIIFIDIIDRMSEIVDEKVIGIENSQKNIEKKLAKVESAINTIEKDIYEDDNETEIICPYCNNEFTTELDEYDENEVECPECHNIIELDLNAEFGEEFLGCSGDCHSCGGCDSEEDDDIEDEEDL